jgi:hypothetical protein
MASALLFFGNGVVFAQTPPPPSFPDPAHSSTIQPMSPSQFQTGGQLPPQDHSFQQPGQFQNDPNFRPDMRSEDMDRMDKERMGREQQHDEERQKQQQQRMLADMQRGSKQMERQLTMIEKRIAALKRKGAIIPADTQGAIDQIKAMVDKMKTATSPEDIEALMGDNDFGDLMQTINEGMQKAEMSTQLPRMLKEADRMLKQQQTALARAQTRAKSMKVNVDSVLSGWQKSVDAIAQGIADAGQASQNNNPEDAMDILKDKVFDAFHEIGDWQQTFSTVSNSQQMLKQADREMVKIDKQIARLKRQKEDTAELESLVAEARAKIAEIKDILAQPSVDSETLIRVIEEGQDIKEEIYEVLSDLTGQQFGQAPQQIPGIQFKPMEPPKGLGQFFRDSDHENTKERCRVEALGADVPGNCQEVQSVLDSRSGSGGAVPMPLPKNQSTSTSAIPGPHSLKNALDDLSPSLRASVIDAFRKYMAGRLRKN